MDLNFWGLLGEVVPNFKIVDQIFLLYIYDNLYTFRKPMSNLVDSRCSQKILYGYLGEKKIEKYEILRIVDKIIIKS